MCKKLTKNSPRSTEQADLNSNECNRSSEMVRVLNVAEKNDAAKNIARIMSGGRSRMREGFSKFNKIYEFEKELPGFGKSQMIFTSVSGHLKDKDFPDQYRKWHTCDPVDMFDLQIRSFVPDNSKPIERTLQREVRSCTLLIIWTDCDREGKCDSLFDFAVLYLINLAFSFVCAIQS